MNETWRVQEYQRRPGKIKAVQFVGTNWVEVQMFCGTRKLGFSEDATAPVFNPIGTFLISWFKPGHENAIAELWVEANQAHVYIEKGEWILQDELGFYPCKDDVFRRLYEPASDNSPDPVGHIAAD